MPPQSNIPPPDDGFKSLATEQPQNTVAGRNVLIGITVALAAWGLFHALGSYFGGMGQENLAPSFWRSLIVVGCMAAFLSIWWWLILTRKPPNSRTDR